MLEPRGIILWTEYFRYDFTPYVSLEPRTNIYGLGFAIS